MRSHLACQRQSENWLRCRPRRNLVFAGAVRFAPFPKSPITPGFSGDPLEQESQPSLFPASYSIDEDFLGIGEGFSGFSVTGAPADANLAVGDTEIVQWVNDRFVVFDKSGTALTPPIDFNTLFTLSHPHCTLHNPGNPIVQFDRVAHRWVLAQNVLTFPYFVCVAVSQTPNELLGLTIFTNFQYRATVSLMMQSGVSGQPVGPPTAISKRKIILAQMAAAS